MSAMNRKQWFDYNRAPLKRFMRGEEVDTQLIGLMNQVADYAERAGYLLPEPVEVPGGLATPVPGLRPSRAACELMHEFEGCRLDAYPDPGSHDGQPWTIGFGSTGPGIHRGVRWTLEQAKERFEADLAKFGAKVAELIGDAPTTQHQFDAMVSLAYNIGVNAFARSTVLRRHLARDYEGAAQAFALWNKNDGRVMAGLTRRRAAEAELYRGRA